MALFLGVAAQAKAQEPDGDGDPFGGRLFAPNVLMQHQQELALTEAQRDELRETVVSAQATIAEQQWNLMEAYQEMIAELDKTPIDEANVLGLVRAALQVENEVKLTQISMLIKLRNLLTDRQIEYLREQNP